MAEDDEGFERFNVENDFEGGQWIGGEFFFSNKRQKRQQTADDRLYGVFADGSDSDGERKQRRRERPDKADYTMPVSFVSTGQVVQDPEERPTFSTAAPSTAGVGTSNTAGLGSAQAAGVSGFKSAGQQHDVEEEDGEEDGVLPTALGKRCGGVRMISMHNTAAASATLMPHRHATHVILDCTVLQDQAEGLASAEGGAS